MKTKSMKQITDKKLDSAFEVTNKALKMARENLTRDKDKIKNAKDFLNMAESYISDASHFRKKGDLVNSFGALYYAHAWLDAGARIGFFEVHDSTLFTAD